MKRKVTPEEREILLDNPELVMFEPYGAVKVHRASLGKALILPFITGAVFFFSSLLTFRQNCVSQMRAWGA